MSDSTINAQTLAAMGDKMKVSPSSLEIFGGLLDGASDSYIEQMIKSSPVIVMASFARHWMTHDLTPEGIELCTKAMQLKLSHPLFMRALVQHPHSSVDYITGVLFRIAKRVESVRDFMMDPKLFIYSGDGDQLNGMGSIVYRHAVEHFPTLFADVVSKYIIPAIEMGSSPSISEFVTALGSRETLPFHAYEVFVRNPATYYQCGRERCWFQQHREDILSTSVELKSYETFFLCYGGDATENEREQILARSPEYSFGFEPDNSVYTAMNLLRIARTRYDPALLAAASLILCDVKHYGALVDALDELTEQPSDE